MKVRESALIELKMFLLNGFKLFWVVLYKIYDLENETVKLLPEGESINDFVEIKKWPWLFEVENDRFPLTVHEAKIDSRNPYSFSEFKAFWSQIQEINKLRERFAVLRVQIALIVGGINAVTTIIIAFIVKGGGR